MKIDTKALPYSEEIFQKLSRGYHYHFDDGIIWKNIQEHFDDYKALFQAVGFCLTEGDCGAYYYFEPEEPVNIVNKQVQIMLTFLLAIIDHCADSGLNPLEKINSKIERKLMHDAYVKNEQLFSYLGSDSFEALLQETVEKIKRWGLGHYANGFLTFKKGINRFIQPIMDIKDDDWKTLFGDIGQQWEND